MYSFKSPHRVKSIDLTPPLVFFITGSSNEVVLLLFVLCVTLLAAGLFLCFVFLLLCLIDSVWHCNHIVGEERTGSFPCLSFLCHL